MDDKKRAARYWLAFLILAVLLVILFVWNVNAGSIHLSVGEIMNIIFRHEGNATAYNYMGNPPAKNSGGNYSGRSAFRIRISPSDIF